MWWLHAIWIILWAQWYIFAMLRANNFAANPCDVGVLNVAAFQQVDSYAIQAVDAWSDSPNAGASFCASCQGGSYYSSQGVVT